MQISLEDRHALVCGSSKGIGKAIAIELAKAGAKITLVARGKKELENLLDQLNGEGHSIQPIDFLSKDETADLVDYVKKSKPDILINNTGGPKLSLACLPHMRETRFGRIINVISTSVRIPIEGLGVSNVTRGAMASWAKTLSLEVAKDGITVNNILPGLTATDRLDSLITNMAADQNSSTDEITRKLIDSIPAKRFAQASEVGNLAVFLASAQASYINGESIRIDGGKTGSI